MFMKPQAFALILVVSLLASDSNARLFAGGKALRCRPKHNRCVPMQVSQCTESRTENACPSGLPCPPGEGCPVKCEGRAGVGSSRRYVGVDRATYQFVNTQNYQVRIYIAEELWDEGTLVYRRCAPNPIEIDAKSAYPLIWEVYWRHRGATDGTNFVAYHTERI